MTLFFPEQFPGSSTTLDKLFQIKGRLRGNSSNKKTESATRNDLKRAALKNVAILTGKHLVEDSL